MSGIAVSIDGQQGTIQENGIVRMGSDASMNVNFYDRNVIDPIKSQQMGRQWMKGAVYVRIQHPGEKDVVDRPVTDLDKARWPQRWAQYEKGHQQVPSGTPIDVLFPQSPEIPANLHSLGVHTVEQLSGLTEHGVQTIGMGSTMWRNKAKQFLDAASGGAGMHRLQQLLDTEKNKNEVLANQVALLKTQVDRLLAQTQQRIPGAMISAEPPPIAQTARMTFANDAPSDTDPAEESDDDDPIANGVYQSSAPLFVEPELADDSPDAGSVVATAAALAPRRRGRPPNPKPFSPERTV